LDLSGHISEGKADHQEHRGENLPTSENPHVGAATVFDSSYEKFRHFAVPSVQRRRCAFGFLIAMRVAGEQRREASRKEDESGETTSSSRSTLIGTLTLRR
jgi:hypothetical protein